MTPSSSSPSAREHSSCVHVSWNATQPPAVRPRQTAAPSISTRRRKPTSCSSAAPTPCQVSSLTVSFYPLAAALEGCRLGGLEAEGLVEGRDSTMLGGMRRRVVDPVATRHDDDQEPDRGEDEQADRPSGCDPVEVRAVVRLRVESSVEAETRRRDGDEHDQVLPPPVAARAHKPERGDREDEVDELDRKRPDRRRQDERRELVVREERDELPVRSLGAELGRIVRGHDEQR